MAALTQPKKKSHRGPFFRLSRRGMNTVKRTASNPSVSLRSGNKKRLCANVSHIWRSLDNSCKAHFTSHMISLHLIFHFHIEDWKAHLGKYGVLATKKSVCVLPREDIQRQDMISAIWPCAIFVSVKMGLVLGIHKRAPTWNSAQTFSEWWKCWRRGGWRHENERTGGQVSH